MGQMGLKKGISSIISQVSNKYWVEQVIEEGIEQNIKSSYSTESFHPSWAGWCLRLIQLTMLGLVKSDIDYKLQRIFDNGDSVHNRYVEYFKKAKKLFNEEISFEFRYKDIFVSGRADVIVMDYDGKKHIGEMKSMNNRRFTDLLVSNSPVEDNFLQWNIYSHGLKIPEGFILYENKDDQRLLIFPVVFNEDKFIQSMNSFVFVNECNKQGKLVPKPEPCQDGKFCRASSFCKSPDNNSFNEAIKNIMLKKLEK